MKAESLQPKVTKAIAAFFHKLAGTDWWMPFAASLISTLLVMLIVGEHLSFWGTIGIYFLCVGAFTYLLFVEKAVLND